MCPFIERPPGFSSEALALLDRALSEIWHETQQQLEKTGKGSASTTTGSDRQARPGGASTTLGRAAASIPRIGHPVR